MCAALWTVTAAAAPEPAESAAPAPTNTDDAATVGDDGGAPGDSEERSSTPTQPPAAPSSSPAEAARAPAPPSEGPAPPSEPNDLEIPDGPPTDPNDAPFMRPPNGQPSLRPAPTMPRLTPGVSLRRRVQLTAVPMYAAVKLPLTGRGASTLHGAGASLQADVQLHSWIYLRLHGGHTVHPVDEIRTQDEETGEVTLLANRGLVQATVFGAAAVLAIDIGRFLPLLDLGLGGLRLTYPEGALVGQQGAPCGAEASCDPGLKCSAEGFCVPSIAGDVHAGLSVDVLLGRHLTVGGEFRYHALLLDPGAIPIYLTLGARVGARW